MRLSDDPQPLLQAALEKLLFLESRLEAAEAARDDALALVDRQREAVRLSRERLGDWHRRAVEAEASAAGAERDAEALRREIVRLREASEALPEEGSLAARLAGAEDRAARWSRERESWLDRMIALERLRHREGDGDELDLGAFIAELRGELLALRRGEERRPLTVSERPPLPDAASLVADLPTAPDTVEGLLEGLQLPRPQRTLLTASGADLESPLPSVRLRAVERLTESGLTLLAPLVVQRMSSEPDPRVRAAMVRHVARASSSAARSSVVRMLSDGDVRVRAAAVDALADIAPGEVEGSLADDSPAVRRRALERLPRNAAAIDRLSDAIHDPDRSVRRVALLMLSGLEGPAARALLEAAAESGDDELRSFARTTLGRGGGEGAVRGPFEDESFAGAVEEELRSALRGRSSDELVDRLGASALTLSGLLERLVAQGRIVRRGPRFHIS
jgi:hypothetical protein